MKNKEKTIKVELDADRFTCLMTELVDSMIRDDRVIENPMTTPARKDLHAHHKVKIADLYNYIWNAVRSEND